MADGGDFLGAAERAVARDKEIREATKELVARQAKGKALKAMRLPPLLAQRRLEHVIPDAAFREACAFDWVHLYQIGAQDSEGPETFEPGGNILKPETSQAWDRDANPRGILLKAGLRALDYVRTNGIDLGHIVRFVKLSPYRIVVDNYKGKDIEILVMRAGSITASQDTEDAVRSGRVKIVWDDESKQHVYQDTKTKKLWIPQDTWAPADYQ